MSGHTSPEHGQEHGKNQEASPEPVSQEPEEIQEDREEEAELVTDPLAEGRNATEDSPVDVSKAASATPPLKNMGDRGNQIAQVVMCIFMIVLAGLLAGYNTLFVPFHGEDLELFIGNDALHRIVTLPAALEELPYAPLTLMGYAINWLFAPFNVTVLHWGTLLLHLGNGILLFLIARRLLPQKSGEPVAMLAGLAFVVHPAHVEAQAYLVGRPLVQGSFFALLALLLFMHRAEDKNPTLGRAVKHFAAILLCYVLAVGSHYALLFLPVLLWGVYWVMPPSERAPAASHRLQKHMLSWLTLAGGGILLVLISREHLFPLNLGQANTALSELMLRGLRILFPVAESAPLFPAVEQLSLNLPGALLVVLLFVGIVALLLQKRAFAIPLLFFGIGLAMLPLVLSGDAILAQRHLYFAVAGAMLAVPFLVVTMARFAGKKGAGVTTGLLLLLVVYGMYSSYVFTLQWRFPESFWTEAAAEHPERVTPWEHLGAYFERKLTFAESDQEAGEWRSKAAQAWQEVLERNPEHADAHAGLGKVLLAQGLPSEAQPHLEMALRRRPEAGDIALALAQAHESAYEARGQEALIQALAYYEHAETHAGLTPEGRLQYGQLAMYFGDFDKSLAQMEQVRAYEGEADTPLADRIEQLRTMQNQQQAMQEQADQIMQEQPGSPESLLVRAEYQLFTGDRLRTFYLLDGLLQREPENRDAWILMGVVRAALEQSEDFLRERGDQHADDRLVWRNLVVRCLSGGHFEEAETYSAHFMEEVRDAEAGTTDEPKILMADFALELGQFMLANMVLQRLIEENPDSYEPWLRLAMIARQQENNQAFQEAFREARRLGAPQDALNDLQEQSDTDSASPVVPDLDTEEESEEGTPEIPRVIIR